jgi:glucosamine--fructose-6-phosphate aminotransferase (isomerizing)
MLVLAQALVATLARDQEMLQRLYRLPPLLEELVSRWQELPRQLGEDMAVQNFFFLGGGPFYGLANEAMLKTKEMSLAYAEAYHPLEFRHGPMSMANEHALVVGFLSDTGLVEELEVLRDVQELGARTLALIEDAQAISGWLPDHLIELRSGLDEWERGPLLLPPVQRMAYHRALAKGLDPDRPHNLTAVVELPRRGSG